jgi:hypothetical protein
MSLVWRQALRLGVILLMCAGIAVATSSVLQTPAGATALSSLVRRFGPENFAGQAAPAAGGPRVRVSPQAAGGGFADAGPRDGGGRLAPNVRAGLPDLLRSAGTIGVVTLVVALLLRRRNPRPQPAPARLARAGGPDIARAA